MFDFLQNYYDWIKAFHIVFMATWMSGMFYLTRVFAYHTDIKKGTEVDKIFVGIEKRVLKCIVNPSMIFTILLGLTLAQIYGWRALGPAFHVKLFCVFLMVITHMILANRRKKLELGTNKHSKIFYRNLSCGIVGAFIIMVVMAAVKPFSG